MCGAFWQTSTQRWAHPDINGSVSRSTLKVLTRTRSYMEPFLLHQVDRPTDRSRTRMPSPASEKPSEKGRENCFAQWPMGWPHLPRTSAGRLSLSNSALDCRINHGIVESEKTYFEPCLPNTSMTPERNSVQVKWPP